MRGRRWASCARTRSRGALLERIVVAHLSDIRASQPAARRCSLPGDSTSVPVAIRRSRCATPHLGLVVRELGRRHELETGRHGVIRPRGTKPLRVARVRSRPCVQRAARRRPAGISRTEDVHCGVRTIIRRISSSPRSQKRPRARARSATPPWACDRRAGDVPIATPPTSSVQACCLVRSRVRCRPEPVGAVVPWRSAASKSRKRLATGPKASDTRRPDPRARLRASPRAGRWRLPPTSFHPRRSDPALEAPGFRLEIIGR